MQTSHMFMRVAAGGSDIILVEKPSHSEVTSESVLSLYTDEQKETPLN